MLLLLICRGIGKETARDLSSRGAKVIMACRNIEAAEKAAEEIRVSNAGIKNKSDIVGKLVVAELDLASLASVHAFAENIIRDEERLDILINNAGVLFPSERNKTEDGLEVTIAVNHLGPFLLTNLLTEKLAEAPELPSRIVNVSSNAHKRGKINLSDLNGDLNYNGIAAYDQSKLANILFSTELAKKGETK